MELERLLQYGTAIEPGDPRHEKVLSFVNLFHHHMGPVFAEHSREEGIDLIVAGMLWLGAGLGLLKHAGNLDINEELLEMMKCNIETGIEMGVKRATEIEQHLLGKLN